MAMQAEIGKLIAGLREGRGFTQKDLADRIGSTQSAVARMEKGEQNFSTEMLEKISGALEHALVTLPPEGVINLEIHGGKKLSGSITTNSSKNGAVGLLTAALLNRGTTTLEHVPRIEEVHRLIEVLQSIGVDVSWKGRALVIRPPKTFSFETLNVESAVKTRSIIMFVGPLIHAASSFQLPQTGGCKLGSRTVRPHFYALENLGVKIKAEDKHYLVTRGKLHSGEMVLYESGDTVTENALMAAARIPGISVIKYASANYQVQELCFFLEKLGVRVEGVGTTTLTVHGVADIHTDITYTLSEDPIDSMLYLTAAVLTESSIDIKRCPIDFLELELLKLEKMGFKYKKGKPYLSYNGKTRLVDITTLPSRRLKALEEKIYGRPYPGLNIDNLPFFAVIATKAEGQTLIHDWVYEKRALYFTELDKLGAETVLADPHRLFVHGPSKLRPTEMVCPPALRPATVILLGMLAAEGRSVLRNIYSINRGYEDLVNKLNSLGADIKILRE